MNFLPNTASLKLNPAGHLPVRRDWVLVLTACFALVWIIHRACVQSITLDEANTYFLWVAPASPSHWEPHSNNHVLNSTLMRAFIWVFGLSHLTVRAPALLGGFIYVAAIYHLCFALALGRLFRWSLFVCFVYNPFIMDYLVAARGYGLALGFLSLAIYFFVLTLSGLDEKTSEQTALKHALAISTCVGMAICANFAFAYAGAFLVLVSGSFRITYSVRQNLDRLFLVRLAIAFALPAILVLLVFAGSALTNFPRGQLFWGANSLVETWKDIRESCFVELNPHLVNPLLADVLNFLKRHLFQSLAVFSMGYTALFCFARWKQWDSKDRLNLLVAGSLGLVLILTLLAHWLQFKFMNIPLPFERTSLFLVPLATALFGATVSITPWNRLARLLRGLAIGILAVTATYFIGELRTSYFREWRIGAEVRVAFPAILTLCRRAGAREIISDQNLASSLNFYRALYHVTDIEPVKNYEALPPGKSLYVVVESHCGDCMKNSGLRVAWRGPVSGLVVLVRPH